MCVSGVMLCMCQRFDLMLIFGSWFFDALWQIETQFSIIFFFGEYEVMGGTATLYTLSEVRVIWNIMMEKWLLMNR